MADSAAGKSAKDTAGHTSPVRQQPRNQQIGTGPLESAVKHVQQAAGNRATTRLILNERPQPLPSSGSEAQPLETSVRTSMESLFDHDFSGVRVHNGWKADSLARSKHASAYTQGQDIVFGAGRYSPFEPQGRSLLAHELAHVIHQSRSGLSQPGVSHEREAENAAQLANSASHIDIRLSSLPGAVQCAPDSLTFPVNDEYQKKLWRGKPIGASQTLPPPRSKRRGKHPAGNETAGGRKEPGTRSGDRGGIEGGEDKGVAGGDAGGHTGVLPQHGMGDDPQVPTQGEPGSNAHDDDRKEPEEGGNGGTGKGADGGGQGEKPKGGKAGSSPAGSKDGSPGGSHEPENGAGGKSSLLGDLAALASLVLDPDSLYEAQHSGNEGTGSQAGSKSGIIGGWFAQILTIALAFGGAILKGLKKLAGLFKSGFAKLEGVFAKKEAQKLLGTAEREEAAAGTGAIPETGGNPKQPGGEPLNPPAARHRVNKVKQNTVAKDKNSIVEPWVDVEADVAQINAGQAKRTGDTFSVNGRTYGHHNGTLYPIQAKGFMNWTAGRSRLLVSITHLEKRRKRKLFWIT